MTVIKFNGNQYMVREATADIAVTLTERASGRQLWQGHERVYEDDGVVVSASYNRLHALVQRTLGLAVDKLLDNAQFRAALRR